MASITDPLKRGWIWYGLWIGCQRKIIYRDRSDVSSSVIHERFETWYERGSFDAMMDQVDERGVPLTLPDA